MIFHKSQKCGFTYWDLGMEMEYKMRLGSELMRRADFVRHIHQTRVESTSTQLQCDGKRNARELIDWDRDNSQRSEFAVTASSRTSSTVTEASAHEDFPNQTKSDTTKHSKKRSHDEEVLEEVKKPASK